MRLRRLVARGFRYYPVLFRSFRGAPDQEVAGFGSPGFQVEASLEESGVATLAAGYLPAGRRKRILLDGDEPRSCSTTSSPSWTTTAGGAWRPA